MHFRYSISFLTWPYLDRPPLFPELLHLASGLEPPLPHRDVGPPAIIRHGLLLQRDVEIERDEPEQFVVFHLRQVEFGATFQ